MTSSGMTLIPDFVKICQLFKSTKNTHSTRHNGYLISILSSSRKESTEGLNITKFVYEGVTKSFRNGNLERELQMVQLSLGAVVSLFCESVW
jgi:hypothetical protein